MAKKEVNIKDLQAKIISLQNEKLNIEAEVKQKVDENDKIHNKNYKLFNEKIAKFDSSKQELVAKLDKQLDEYKAASEENHRKMQFHTTELTRSYDELKMKYETKEKEANELKNHIASLKLEHQKVAQNNESSLKEVKSAFDELRADVKQKESEYLAKIQQLDANIRAKDVALAAIKREEGLKATALEKEIKSKEVDIVALKDDITRKEEAIKGLQVKLKTMDDNSTKNTNKTIQELKDKLALLEKNRLAEETKIASFKEELKRKESEYLEQIKEAQKEIKSKEALLTQNKDGLEKKLLSSEQAVKTLSEKIKFMETITPTKEEKSPKPTSSKAQKMELVASVSCTDMGTGVNAISASCKQNVKALLAQYDSSYFYEVAPIVYNGGFASLKLIKSKKVGVEDSEIDRISGLANIGLGKARAKAGGDLIQEYLGENAKISYALSNIEQDKARGFQIKVYR